MYSDKEITKHIGEKIQHYRKLNNLTQKELGDKIMKSANTISQYESGLNAPSQEALFNISCVLDVPTDNFFPKKDVTNSYFESLKLYSDDLNEKDKKEFIAHLEVAVEVFKRFNQNMK